MYKKRFRQLGMIIVVLLIPIIPFAIIGELPGERWLSATDGDALLFGLTGSALLLLDIVLPVPSSILGTLLGARLGLVPGFVATWLGLTGGHAIGYLLGRLTLRRIGADLPQGPTLLIVFLSRPVPVLAEAMALASGASGLPVLQFLALCGAGNAVYAAVLSANGAAVLPSVSLVTGLVVPMLLPVLGWSIWRAMAARSRCKS